MVHWDRLELLSKKMRFVADTEPEKFDIGSWFSFADTKEGGYLEVGEEHRGQKIEVNNADPFYDTERFLLKDGFCGTSACVLGWAATIPEFNKLGLNTVIDKNTRTDGSWRGVHGSIVFINDKGDITLEDGEAGAEFFGLSKGEAKVMFATASDDDTDDWYTFGGTVEAEENDYGETVITAAMVANRLEAACAARDLGMAKYDVTD